MPTTTTPGVEKSIAVPPKAPTLVWALRRALLAILILFFSISGVAWLFYASTDLEPNDVPVATSSNEGASASPLIRQPASLDPKIMISGTRR